MGKTQNRHFYDFRNFWTCPRAQKPTIFIFGDPKILWNIQENAKSLRNLIFYRFLKLWRSNMLKILSNTILKILDMGSTIFQKIWNGHLVNLWGFETKKPRNRKTRNFETKKLRNQEPPQHTDSHPCTRQPSACCYVWEIICVWNIEGKS